MVSVLSIVVIVDSMNRLVKLLSVVIMSELSSGVVVCGMVVVMFMMLRFLLWFVGLGSIWVVSVWLIVRK